MLWEVPQLLLLEKVKYDLDDESLIYYVLVIYIWNPTVLDSVIGSGEIAMNNSSRVLVLMELLF